MAANEAAVNCGLALALPMNTGAVGCTGAAVGLLEGEAWMGEEKRAEDGETELLQVPGGTGEDGERLRLLREEERESMGWKERASGLKVWLAACTSLSIVSQPSSSWRSEYRILMGLFSLIRYETSEGSIHSVISSGM